MRLERGANNASCHGLQRLTGLKQLWGLGMEPNFLSSADQLLTWCSCDVWPVWP
jgi:hypothetical protein